MQGLFRFKENTILQTLTFDSEVCSSWANNPFILWANNNKGKKRAKVTFFLYLSFYEQRNLRVVVDLSLYKIRFFTVYFLSLYFGTMSFVMYLEVRDFMYCTRPSFVIFFKSRLASLLFNVWIKLVDLSLSKDKLLPHQCDYTSFLDHMGCLGIFWKE